MSHDRFMRDRLGTGARSDARKLRVRVPLALVLLLACVAPAGAQPAAAARAVQRVSPSVPDVLGRTLSEARRVLSDSGYAILVSYRDVRAALGLVLEQRPKAGSAAARGSEVEIVVGRNPSSGRRATAIAGPTLSVQPGVTQPQVTQPALVEVPSLVGLDRSEALRALLAVKLRPGLGKFEPSDLVPTGRITHHEPIAGTRVVPGTLVNITVSTGPHDDVVPALRMPSLLGLAPAAAAETLRANGLRLDHVDSSVAPRADRRVLSQFPSAGTEVHRADPVRFSYRYPPATVTVPDVRGLTAIEAQTRLDAVSLAVAEIRRESRADLSAGVVRQSPEARTTVEGGSGVILWINTPPVPDSVAVPPIVSLRRSEAEELIRRAGLTPLPGATDAGRKDEIVRSQSPDAGVRLPLGGAVSFTTTRPTDSVSPPDSVAVADSNRSGEAPPADDPAAEVPSGEEAPAGERSLQVTVPPLEARGLVPALIGRTVTEAIDLAEQAGFVFLRISGSNEPGAIVNTQSPDAGELVSLREPIQVTAIPSAVRIVPDLVGLDVDEARRVAANADFATRIIDRQWTTALRSRVLAQDPSSGEAPPGITFIALTVGRPLVPVVSVIGGLLGLLALGVRLRGATIRAKGDRPSRTKEDRDRDGPSIRIKWTSSSRDAVRVWGGEKGTVARARIEVRFSTVIASPVITCEFDSVFKSRSVTDGS